MPTGKTVLKEIIHICSVCDPGWYGEECDRQCNCRDSADCDHTSGWCRDGCRAGKQGDSCQCDCEDGAYGLDCTESCGHCLGGKVCDKVTGSCSQDCVQGFKPPLCKECNDGKFGINCLSTCGKCSGNENCNKTDGTCQNGCLEHYIPPMCTECKDGRFGINCQSTCGKCEGNESCNKTDGTCPNGCEERYNPPMCTDCVGGRYGENCDRKCGHCLNDLPCNMTTGECGDFCSSDYKPPLCDECVRGRYGTDCMSICGQCADNATCSSDGTCPRGCLPGFTDELCQTLVSTVPSKIAPIAGGVAAVIVLMIIIVVVIVILKRRLQRKSPTTVANRGENQKDTSFIDISEPHGGGTEYYSVIPAPVNLPKLARYIKDRINGVGFDNEFKLLPYGIHEDHDEGKKPENKKRNRFLELYPYDHSRVVLKPEHDADWDYINASYINGYRGTKTFIAAQGPKPVTVDDFWRMIWQQQVTMIVMVTRLTELTKKKCEQYWTDEKEVRNFGNIKVHHEYSTVRRDCTIRTFNVKHSEDTSESREITQLQFTSWPDHDVPSAPALVSFWKQFRRLHQESGPVVVHCSAGVGRTGTFIALDWLFEEAEREKKVNVFNCVNQMRKARMNMVQTTSQYGFLHEVVLEAVQSRNTFYTSTEFLLKFGTDKSITDDQESEMQRQFEKLNTMRKIFTDKQVSDAKLPENICKNRDQNILPENKSKPYLMIPVKDRNQYINAVVLPSHVSHSAVIATQTPLPDTVVDFWRLVYDHEILNVICLEGYEILYPSEDAIVESGSFQISSLDQRTSISSQTKIILTKLEQPDESRQITVYRPSCERPLDLVEFVNEIVTRGMFGQGQLLVHCNNGSDLCGLFCGVLNIITRLILDREVDIFLDIRELQTIRPSFIPSLDQYRFCFEAVKEYGRSTSIYANV